MKDILLIPKIQAESANAHSSPYSGGFPAMTAWMGFAHLLERKLQQTSYAGIKFKSVGVVSHDFTLRNFKHPKDFCSAIIGRRLPPQNPSQKGAPLIPDLTCDLTVSIVLECSGMGMIDHEDFTNTIRKIIYSLKLASGDIVNLQKPEVLTVHDEKSQKTLLRRLMPGNCLIERRDLIQKAMENGQDALEAVLSHTCIEHSYNEVTDKWESKRKTSGWLVPITTGYQGLTKLGPAENTRDANDTPHRFAEAIVTLCEFIMPYKIVELDNMLWHYHSDMNKDLYLCQQNKPTYSGENYV